VRVGICSYWFNRGQGVVGRQLRSALDELGHQTFVLARPTRARNVMPRFVDRSDVWDQPGVTVASKYRIPADELERWSRENEIEACFFDQNYEFDSIERLRAAGVRTVGRFVWEHFAEADVAPARRAFDLIYSLTACERERYAGLGIESPRVRWGCHPDLLETLEERPFTHPAAPASEQARMTGRPTGSLEAEDAAGNVLFFFPGGFMSKRKPLAPTLEAFRRAHGDGLRLVVKAQVERGAEPVRQAERQDRRVRVVVEDLPAAEHLALFASADVCLAPSRWEGLGLHLYEATALGLPVITNDNPPMNEVVEDEVNGLLVRGVPSAERPRSGIPSFDPDVGELAAAIERMADPDLRSRLSEGAGLVRERLAWSNTVTDLEALLGSLR
jgi:1,2-diacylglycerol 3-alpha-glucosyltransferase